MSATRGRYRPLDAEVLKLALAWKRRSEEAEEKVDALLVRQDSMAKELEEQQGLIDELLEKLRESRVPSSPRPRVAS